MPTQLTPAQQAAAINAQARALIKARAVKMKQVIFNQSSIVPANTPVVTLRVGMSYVSLANARANLAADNPKATTL